MYCISVKGHSWWVRGVGGGRQVVSNVAMHTKIVSPPLRDRAQKESPLN